MAVAIDSIAQNVVYLTVMSITIAAVMTLVCGLLGIPPVNGVIPQSPMHTKSLSSIAKPASNKNAKNAKVNGKSMDENHLVTSEANTPIRGNNRVIPLVVSEQRGSGFAQSLGIAACLGLTPAIRWIPTAVLWGYGFPSHPLFANY